MDQLSMNFLSPPTLFGEFKPFTSLYEILYTFQCLSKTPSRFNSVTLFGPGLFQTGI